MLPSQGRGRQFESGSPLIMQNRKIILASSSPRRKRILSQIGLDFSVEVTDIDEKKVKIKNPRLLVQELSLLKAKAILKKKGSIILAADTVVVFENKILGKPQSAEDAKKMLKMLSGKRHSVITGFTIIDPKYGKVVTKSEETKVWFRKIPKEEVEKYVATGEPLDKAGAYGIQELGSVFVKKIEGDFFNVVGLPISFVWELEKLGVNIF